MYVYMCFNNIIINLLYEHGISQCILYIIYYTVLILQNYIFDVQHKPKLKL